MCAFGTLRKKKWGGVTSYVIGEQTLYNDLIQAGLSGAQAAGVMGNAQYESGDNVEASAVDSNGKLSNGLIQWNEGTYPNAGSLVTGNGPSDLNNQIQFLLHNTNNTGKGLAGTSAAQVAGNWAQYVEVCAGCQPGGSQYNARVAAAQQIYNDAVSNNWPTPTTGSASNTSNTASNASLLSDLFGNIPQLLTSAAGDIGSAILGSLGIPSLKDMLERLGLLILGAIVLFIGIRMLVQSDGKQAINIAPEDATATDSGLRRGGDAAPKAIESSAPEALETTAPEALEMLAV